MVGLRDRCFRASLTTWSRLAPHFELQTGPRKFKVTPSRRDTLCLRKWSPNWKSRSIARVLRARGGWFIDVGANVGQTLVDYVAAGIGDGYVGFEPNTRLVAQLNSMIEENGLQSCMVVPTGLSDSCGLAPLHTRAGHPDDAAATIIPGLRPDFGELRVQLIPVSRFDEVRPMLPAQRIGLMKIDVEGAEALAIAGMTETLRSERPWIICEVLRHAGSTSIADTNARADRLMEMLKACAYQVLLLRKTQTEGDVLGLEPLEAFPHDAYTPENAPQHDYAFIPAEDAAQAGLLAQTQASSAPR